MIVWTLAAIIALFVGSGLLITSFEPESLVASTGLFASGILLICSSVYLLYTMW